MKILFLLFLSFVIGLISAFIISKFGSQLSLLDIPNVRSAHTIPIPRGGGIGIPIAVGLITFFFVNTGYFLVGLALISGALAFINDKSELSIRLRFIFGFIFGLALVLVIVTGKTWLSLINEYYGIIVVLFVLIFLTIYVVAATNFFNFMDGINGIAGFEALISFIFLGVYALYFKNSPEISMIAFSVAAAAAGFLLLNFPKAKVFMGDVGSIFVGFFFAGMVVYLVMDLKELLLLALFQSVFYIDCISTIFIRLWNRENIFEAHKKHFYQKLVHCLGWTHSRVTIYFGLAQILIGLLGLVLFRMDLVFLFTFWGILFVAYWSILIRLKLIKA